VLRKTRPASRRSRREEQFETDQKAWKQLRNFVPRNGQAPGTVHVTLRVRVRDERKERKVIGKDWRLPTPDAVTASPHEQQTDWHTSSFQGNQD
jgi:hypothetical protein